MMESAFDVHFVVRKGDLGRSVLEREGFSVFEIAGQGLPRKFSPALFSFPFKLLQGWFQTCRLLKDQRPAAVIGMGGYLSFPVLLAARLSGIFTLIHEQNVLPGLTNRLLSRIVTSVALSFKESEPYFPSAKRWIAGLPVRDEIGKIDAAAARRALDITTPAPVILVFGGSQGAHRLNVRMVEALRELAENPIAFQVVHISGEKNYDSLKKLYEGVSFQYRVMAYCHQMAEAYAAAHVIVCRSGASTIAELQQAHRPAILVPFPYASGNHQFYNAKVLSDVGAAKIIEEKNMNTMSLVSALTYFLSVPAPVTAPPLGVPDTAAQRMAAYLGQRMRL